MHITILGAKGNVGSRIVAEALSRKHEVTAVVFSPADFDQLPTGVNVRAGDVGNPSQVAEFAAGQDMVISAIRPPDGKEELLGPLTRSVLDGAAMAGTRVLICGGASSLKMPKLNGTTVLDAPGFLPDAVLPIARACFTQYEVSLAHDTADWVYISPPALLKPGTRTGSYRTGKDTLLIDDEGTSAISMEDYAVAILDEAENPKHEQVRFTVGY